MPPLHQKIKIKVSKGLVEVGLAFCLLEQLSMMQLPKHVSVRKTQRSKNPHKPIKNKQQ
jgi:hypothetical protein